MQIAGYNVTKRLQQPAFVRVVLEYANGAVVSKDFTTARQAVVFLEGQERV